VLTGARAVRFILNPTLQTVVAWKLLQLEHTHFGFLVILLVVSSNRFIIELKRRVTPVGCIHMEWPSWVSLRRPYVNMKTTLKQGPIHKKGYWGVHLQASRAERF